MAAVFEGWGPTLNHWNYCYCAMREEIEPYGGYEPYPYDPDVEQTWQWQFLGPSTLSTKPWVEVYRPYGPRLNAAGCTAYRGVNKAIIRLEFASNKTRLQVHLYNRFESFWNAGCPGEGVGPSSFDSPTGGQLWVHRITYEINSSDYKSILENGVFRFRKSDIVAQDHFGTTSISFIETSAPIPLAAFNKPLKSMQTNVPADFGDVIIVRPVREHQLNTRDFLVTFTGAVGIDEHGTPNCEQRKVKYRIDGISGIPFELATDNPPLTTSPYTDGILARPPDGPCVNPVGNPPDRDGLVAISRPERFPSATNAYLPSMVTLFARGSFSSWTSCDANGVETCGNNSGDVSRYDRPTLYFDLNDYHWSALADKDNRVQLSFGCTDASPFWMPGWSWPAMNPATVTIENLNPVQSPPIL